MPTKEATVEAAEPTWEIAHLFPPQGMWTEEEYLSLPTNRLVEYGDGHLEVLPVPTQSHQLIVAYLYRFLTAFLDKHYPEALLLFAPLPVRLRSGKYREPDLILMLAKHAAHRHERYWERPDLVMEIVSPDGRHRDEVVKREEYAAVGIPEYWIVDPEQKQITVLTLREGRYHEHGVFGSGQKATSVLLPGFEVAIDAVWAAAEV